MSVLVLVLVLLVAVVVAVAEVVVVVVPHPPGLVGDAPSEHGPTFCPSRKSRRNMSTSQTCAKAYTSHTSIQGY